MTPEERKQQKKEYDKEYREKNKEKINNYRIEYSKKNPEAVLATNKKYRDANKEKIKEFHKNLYKENKEKIDKRNQEYNQTEAGKKSFRISAWKKRGVICDDFDSLYDKFINCKNCEECAVELVEGMYGANKRCLDHSHKTGLFRNVLCNTCNTKRGE